METTLQEAGITLERRGLPLNTTPLPVSQFLSLFSCGVGVVVRRGEVVEGKEILPCASFHMSCHENGA